MEMIAAGGAALASAGTAAAPFLAPISLGMTILGAAGQSQAQREAGNVAYQSALLRNQQAQQQAALLDQQAQQQQQAAGQEDAAGQRQKIEAIRRGSIMAARAKAVMAASGAGIDDNLVASLQGEGIYAGDVAGYNASERSRALTNQAEVTRYNAAGMRWAGSAGVGMGATDIANANRRADTTLIGGIGQGVLSFASKYGGSAPTRTGGGTATGDFRYDNIDGLIADQRLV